jgi:hypothetical protein
VLRTRPEHAESKQGTSGRTVDLAANYFKIIKKPSFQFCLYEVKFDPEVVNRFARKAFINRQSEYFKGHLFDGCHLIYMTHRLPDDQKVFDIKDKFSDQEYKMTVTFTKRIIEDTDPLVLNIYNIMMRRAMEALCLEQVGRNLYDAKSKVSNWK